MSEDLLAYWKVEFGSYAFVYQLWETDMGYHFGCVHEPSLRTVFSAPGESIGEALGEGFRQALGKASG